MTEEAEQAEITAARARLRLAEVEVRAAHAALYNLIEGRQEREARSPVGAP